MHLILAKFFIPATPLLCSVSNLHNKKNHTLDILACKRGDLARTV